ncbi:MAG: right-handed parallel beta-helix repeat-containing protein [Anaerolinea sp.]|nr:right-handed parallel beta-helix repeat-containing protein [Anaerolinea sp.]
MLVLVLMTGGSLSAKAQGAATYFVALNGDDANRGTETAPFLTMQHAVEVAQGGDTIYVRAGLYYTDPIHLTAQLDKPLTIRAFPDETVILDGSRAPDESDIFYIPGWRYIIQGFEIRNAKRIGINLYPGSATFIEIRENVIRDSDYGAIYSGGSSYLTIDGNTIYHNVRRNDRFQFDHASGWDAAVSIDGTNNRVTHNQIYENWGEGIGCYGTDHVVAYNTLHDNYSVDLYVNNVRNTVVEGNFIYSLNLPAYFRETWQGTGPAVGIQFSNENPGDVYQFDNVRIVNNIITGRRLWGMYNWSARSTQYGGGAPRGMHDSLIAFNTVAAFGSVGLIHLDAAGHRDTLISGNIFYQLNADSPNTDFDSSTGITFDHNLWYCGNGAYDSYGGDGSGNGDVRADPRLLNPLGMSVDDFRLLSDSPAVDAAGESAGIGLDLFETLRPTGNRFDIGAVEFDPANQPSAVGTISLPCQPLQPPPAVVPAVSTVISGDETLITLDDVVTGTGVNQFRYSRGWQTARDETGTSAPYNGTNSYNAVRGATVQLSFIGTQIDYYAVEAPNHGIVAVSIDDGTESLVDLYRVARAGDQLVWSSPVLPMGEHVFTVRVTGENNTSASAAYGIMDRVVIHARQE